ncbi:MAG TPA: dipeptide/oligopeptide/nickel ABC transporter permease/ATP-binding protein [Gaiellaceae bacterium]|nr:dipeptide/oligopeptide/nickel ABC transporter permease/ATP-binding protein [Gaiellaceae bacterium]
MSITEAAPQTIALSEVTSSRGFVRRLARKPLAVVCLAYLAVLIAVAILAPIALPHVATEHAGDLLHTNEGPSWAHPLGTDTLGRDVLDRLLVGTRVTLIGIGEALVVILALGLPLGLVAGYFGGKTDTAVSWLADLTFSIPAIVLVLVVLAVFPESMAAAMIAFGVLAAPALMRVVRISSLAVREQPYVAAARVGGLSHRLIMTRHVGPRIVGPVIVQASLLAAVALLLQAGLAFLHLVVAPPAPSWGGMVADGASVIQLQPWLIVPPGVAIALTVLSLGLLGDSLRDAATEDWLAAPNRSRRSPRAGGASPEARGVSAIASRPEPDRALLAVSGLDITLRGRTDIPLAVDVSFDVRERECLGIVGESGCGKSITAMAILGLLPSGVEVTRGSIRFAGHDLTATGERELRRIRGSGIGLVSQEPQSALDPSFRIGHQITEAVTRHQKLGATAARSRALELLEWVRLDDPSRVARAYPHEISGGMAQRVCIARALAGNPRLLIADEPTTALDVTVQAEILALLDRLRDEHGLGIVLISHDWGVVAESCDRVVVMYAGEVVERAEVADAFDNTLHPYTDALRQSDPHLATRGDSLRSIVGTVPSPGSWPEGCHFHPRCAFARDDCRARRIPLLQFAREHESRCIHVDDLRAARR